MQSFIKYSIVIPVFNEEESLLHLHERLKSILDCLDGSSEVIFIDDGSRDDSLKILRSLHQKDSRFLAISFSRNFGHQMALTAGLDYARGQAIITMDADLQDPPELILELVEKWQEGYEIVYAVRRNRDVDQTFKRFSALAFYHVLRSLATIEAPINSADFRLIDRKVLRSFRRLREKNRYIRGLFSWLGYKQTEVYYDRKLRYAGETKYPLMKMLNLAFDAIVSFSNLPLKMCMTVGFLVASLAFIYGIWNIVAKIFGWGTYVSGWASLAVLMSFLGGIHIFLIGVLGEYISRIYDEVRGRPLYVVSEFIDENKKEETVNVPKYSYDASPSQPLL